MATSSHVAASTPYPWGGFPSFPVREAFAAQLFLPWPSFARSCLDNEVLFDSRRRCCFAWISRGKTRVQTWTPCWFVKRICKIACEVTRTVSQEQFTTVYQAARPGSLCTLTYNLPGVYTAHMAGIRWSGFRDCTCYT